ncbi:hypothetical protein MKW98_026117 [Papaver atlanticum]|uniref:3'-5' exonuclease domain-containing protein n=1 Tax=Papaver atlanticum TaxID=357466 RepID=A0AAD4X5V4_9MAGN|nr:hypothetical protein MKW98_026117 [Papaver atlanticum]
MKTNCTFCFNGVNIVTTVTNSPSVIDSVLKEFRSESLIGLDIEWNSASHNNKVATLQLCHGTRCIIIQLLRLDFIPSSLRTKLDRDYGLKCWSVKELGPLADRVYRTQQFHGAGLSSLMHQIVGVRVEQPEHVKRSNWGVNILNTEQIKYATIDAYALSQLQTSCCLDIFSWLWVLDGSVVCVGVAILCDFVFKLCV